MPAVPNATPTSNLPAFLSSAPFMTVSRPSDDTPASEIAVPVIGVAAPSGLSTGTIESDLSSTSIPSRSKNSARRSPIAPDVSRTSTSNWRAIRASPASGSPIMTSVTVTRVSTSPSMMKVTEFDILPP